MRRTAMIRFRMNSPRKFPAVLLLAALCLFLATSSAGQIIPSAPARIVAIGDVHGDYDDLAAMLQRTSLIDEKLGWSARGAALVQTGDFLDRGPKDREVMDLLMRLEKEAPKKGSRVIVLLGNHEVMNMIGDLWYVSSATYASFADKNSEKRRQSAWRDYVDFRKALAKRNDQPAPAFTPEDEKAWMEAHPPGYLEHREAFGPTGKYGRWLREHFPVAQIGDTLFVHGGISPALAATGVENINKKVQAEVTEFDAFRTYFVEQKIILPFFDLQQVTQAATDELDALKAEQGRKEAGVTAAGKKFTPNPEVKKQIGHLRDFLAYTRWYSVHPDGPLWFRGYAEWNDVDGAAQIEKLRGTLRVERLVVGHTPQPNGRIRVRFDGRVFLIDTGMLPTHYPGGRPSALEIQAGSFTAVYPHERVALWGAAARSMGNANSPPEPPQPDDLPGGPLAEESQQRTVAAAETAAPQPAAATVWLDANGKPLPFKSDEEVMQFLAKARVVKVKGVSKGITHIRRVLIEKDGIQANAALRVLDEEKTVAQLAGGTTEMFFRDTYIFDCAAYELAKMLGEDTIPPVVIRRMLGEKGSLQIWVENGMTEEDRQRKNIPPAKPESWNRQLWNLRIFDNLIYNTDRNMGNLIIDKDWKIWWIDHSRAFRRHEGLNFPGTIYRVSRRFWERLQNLDANEMRTRLKPYLRQVEIEALLKRRDKIVEMIRKMIAERGEADVVFDDVD
jgi:hypothetical protein